MNTHAKRTHYCGTVTEALVGQNVMLTGWVHKRRDLGKLIFIALRDRSGIVQITVDGNIVEPELFKTAESSRGEYVLAVTGVVRLRTPENRNADMKTGKIEVEAYEICILSEAEVPPFQVADVGVGNDLRLKYRYLDLRRPELQHKLFTRHKITKAARDFLDNEGFIEVETPMLTRDSPEGAKAYLVPSRVHPGNIYALPQSPQLFKQILMVSGFDKYYQIARCFRDEDLRANRQPEFTQIDMELSFVEPDDIIDLNERLIRYLFGEVLGIDVPVPFPRMTYNEAMSRFGSDKPDTRFGMELTDISERVRGCGFAVFEDALADHCSVRGINAKGCAGFSRKQIDAVIEVAKEYKAKGLAWIIVGDEGIRSSISKFFDEDALKRLISAFKGEPGDLILICADKNEVVFDSLGAVRLDIARKMNLLNDNEYNFLWITEFPLLEWNEDDKRFYAKHHPFTSPMNEDIALLETNPIAVRAKAYDMVLNGVELGGGSIRIHRRDLQEMMFKALGFSQEQAEERFGFLLNAFRYGTPPHGGLAFGLDRIVMLMTGTESIRDVIAFPKVKDASCPMTDAPSPPDAGYMRELGFMALTDK